MEYTVQGLSRLSGISKRAIRYYDEIGILKPARINSSGYRIYGKDEVDRLQQILFYRELGVSLESIKNIMLSTGFDTVKALKEHHEKLLEKRRKLDLIISNVEKTIAFREGRIKMTDSEKFEGFKEKLIEDNEKKYGREIREKYGDDTVERSNKKFKGMTEKQYREAEKLESDMLSTLEAAIETEDPAGELAQKAADMHKRWLCYFWDSYSKEAHAGVAQMYVEDRRFTAYYDKKRPGMAKFLRDAILFYTGMNK
jgi:DNA-binding transcriptional MerR regulator